MNILIEYIIPSIIILIANIFSYEYGSQRYEKITAMFGWVAGITLTLVIIFSVISTFFHNLTLEIFMKISKQIFIFSLVTALFRDYEKILKPMVGKYWKK